MGQHPAHHVGQPAPVLDLQAFPRRHRQTVLAGRHVQEEAVDGLFYVRGDINLDGRVATQSPDAGVEVTQGATITVTLGDYVEPTTTTGG